MGMFKGIDDIDAFLEGTTAKNVPQFPFSLYFSEGCKYNHLRLFDKAVGQLDKALEKDPGNVRALLKRSHSYLRLQRFNEARADAIEIIKDHPEIAEAVDLKGQSEYNLGDFEGGYLTYSDGMKYNPSNRKLRIGMLLCREGIDNSMIHNSGWVGTGDIRRLLKPSVTEWKGVDTLKGLAKTFECFGPDKELLGCLLGDRDLSCVHSLCGDALDYAVETERFWSMQKPLHTRKKLSRKQRPRAPPKAQQLQQHLTAMRTNCEYYMRRGMANLCIREGLKLGLFAGQKGMGERQKLLLKGDILHLMSVAYRAEGKDAEAKDALQKELAIGERTDYTPMKARVHQSLAMQLLGEGYQKEGLRQFMQLEEVLKSSQMDNFTRNVELGVSGFDMELSDMEDARRWYRNFKGRQMEKMRSSVIVIASQTFKMVRYASSGGSAEGERDPDDRKPDDLDRPGSSTSQAPPREDFNLSRGQGPGSLGRRGSTTSQAPPREEANLPRGQGQDHLDRRGSSTSQGPQREDANLPQGQGQDHLDRRGSSTSQAPPREDANSPQGQDNLDRRGSSTSQEPPREDANVPQGQDNLDRRGSSTSQAPTREDANSPQGQDNLDRRGSSTSQAPLREDVNVPQGQDNLDRRGSSTSQAPTREDANSPQGQDNLDRRGSSTSQASTREDANSPQGESQDSSDESTSSTSQAPPREDANSPQGESQDSSDESSSSISASSQEDGSHVSEEHHPDDSESDGGKN